MKRPVRATEVIGELNLSPTLSITCTVRIIFPRMSLRALHRSVRAQHGSCMQRQGSHRKHTALIAGVILLMGHSTGSMAGQPSAAATATYNGYVGAVDARLTRQHATSDSFLAGVDGDPQQIARLHRGELIIDQLAPSGGDELPGALLHHWRATAFAPEAKAQDFEGLLRDFAAYPRLFAPQVLQARVLWQRGDDYETLLRFRQKHVLTVTLDAACSVTFGWLDPRHGFSASHSTSISEIGPDGRPLSGAEEHGFLWRQDTWWSYEERDGGLYLQVESVSLSRGIPAGLGWAVGPFVSSIPRQSLAFTLRAACDALRDLQIRPQEGR
jgi:hypothetical protein